MGWDEDDYNWGDIGLGVWDDYEGEPERKRWSKRDVEYIWKRDIGKTLRTRCPICNDQIITITAFEMGHIKSLAHNGTNSLNNVTADMRVL